MKDKCLISIIVPVYNAESTIENAIASVVSDNVPIEIICVDDGSSDNSGEILNKIAENDTRVRVIHQKNSGAGAARNRGLFEATGEYIMFLDSDDIYMSDTISVINEDIKEYNPEYIAFRRISVSSDGSKRYWGSGNKKRVLNCTWFEYLNDIMIDCNHGNVCYTKVFKRSIIVDYNIKFEPQFLFGEDLWFLLTYLSNLSYESCMLEDFRAVYQQNVIAGSICRTGYDDFFQKNMLCIKQYRKMFPENAEKIQLFFNKQIFSVASNSLTRLYRGVDGADNKHRKEICKSILQDDDFKRSVCVIAHLPENSYWKKKAKWIEKLGLFGYKFRFFTIPSIKKAIKRKLHH